MAMPRPGVGETHREVPKFVKLIQRDHPGHSIRSVIKEIIDDVFNISVQRGLNDYECSLILGIFLDGSISMNDKLKLLQNMVPENKVPSQSMRSFMLWFISDFRKDNNVGVAASSRILQWIIGLLEHGLVDSQEIYNFYHDLYVLLELPLLVPYAAKLLCKLTKPDDVTRQSVRIFWNSFDDPNNKYLLAVLNVFKGYKPHLMPEDVRKVDVLRVLDTVPQTMDLVMRARIISSREHTAPPHTNLGVQEVVARNFTYFKEEFNKNSSLIPLPIYNFEGMDKFGACYANSVEEACRKFSRVPIPQNILSLLLNETGFFTIMYQGIEEQTRFQSNLLHTLQNALIFKKLNASNEDVEILLRRIYSLERYLQQGIPSVSVFLSGYLLDWDGLDYRHSVLKLIEWVSFHSFKELASNILRPLYLLFVSNDTSMKKAIIQTLTNLIENMFGDVRRVVQGFKFPFLRRGPKWTREPRYMLAPLVAWTRDLIVLGLATERNVSTLLTEAIHFYYQLNMFEASSNLPMFTVVPEEVVLMSLLSQNPNAIFRICDLLLRYNREFLPQLRTHQPTFYKQCKEQICIVSNYASQIIYYIHHGKFAMKEHRMVMSDMANETSAEEGESFQLVNHWCFVCTFVIFEKQKNLLELSDPHGRRASIERATLHLRPIKEFIDFFSPPVPEPEGVQR